MLYIDPIVIGQKFYKNDPDIIYTCVGYGQDPTSAANYVIGQLWNQTDNRTKVSTHLFKEVTFMGQFLTTQ
jgi:hypothetical protein